MRPQTLVVLLALLSGVGAVKSALVHVNADGSLSYTANSQGDRLMDYSSAGYQGGQDLPAASSIPNKVTVKPSGGDDSAAIQKAINQVSAMPLENGFRGAVLLTSGSYKVTKGLVISASGVVLRGSGTSTQGSVISTSITDVLTISGAGKPRLSSTKYTLANKYVPFGGNMLQLQSTSGLKVSDSIMIHSTITGKLIKLLGMDRLVRDGKNQTWIKAGSAVTTDRIITAISGNNITLDAGFPDSIRPELFDSANDLPYVQVYTWSERIYNSGVESLRVIHPQQDVPHQFASINSAIHCWARNLYLQDFISGVLTTGAQAKMITIQGLEIVYTAAYSPAAPPQILSMEGTQILHRDSNITGGGKYWPLSAGSTRMRGPVVHYNIKINAGPGAQVVPHMRWSTAILYDNVQNTHGNIGLSYRTTMGSGHGWTMGWGAIYNCEAATLVAQNPYNHYGPYNDKQVLYHNWLIGGKGKNIPGYMATQLQGTYDSAGTMVEPQSLYQAQLNARRKNRH